MARSSMEPSPSLVLRRRCDVDSLGAVGVVSSLELGLMVMCGNF